MLFLDFFYRLRDSRVPVSTHNWNALLHALAAGLHDDSLEGFYQVSRCLLVTSETHYDAFDRAFGEVFRGVEQASMMVLDHLDEWLNDPARLEALPAELREALQTLDIEELRELFKQRLAEQRRRHQGGNRWIGTGGTSPFGQGGYHPSGVRIGGLGGGRSALAVADERRFEAYRQDITLDVRQIAAALRKLRLMSRKGVDEELDLDETIRSTVRQGGELELEFRPPRKNNVRVLLLMDVGGSMDPFAHRCSRLFSAAHQSGGFRSLRSYYFHNCIYHQVYEDASFKQPVSCSDLLRELDDSWRLIVVGDAYMHPGELLVSSGDWWQPRRGPAGITWLARFADRFSRAAWLNPESPKLWSAPSVIEIRRIFPMFPLTLEGLDEMVKALQRPMSPTQRAMIQQLVREGQKAAEGAS